MPYYVPDEIFICRALQSFSEKKYNIRNVQKRIIVELVMEELQNFRKATQSGAMTLSEWKWSNCKWAILWQIAHCELHY